MHEAICTPSSQPPKEEEEEEEEEEKEEKEGALFNESCTFTAAALPFKKVTRHTHTCTTVCYCHQIAIGCALYVLLKLIQRWWWWNCAPCYRVPVFVVVATRDGHHFFFAPQPKRQTMTTISTTTTKDFLNLLQTNT